MRAIIRVSLYWGQPTDSEWLAFDRIKTFGFVPPVGMTLHFHDPSRGGFLSVVVSSLDYWEMPFDEEVHVAVHTLPMPMGTFDTEAVKDSIAWMKSYGFTESKLGAAMEIIRRRNASADADEKPPDTPQGE